MAKNEKICIIGAGPAGLSAAVHLEKNGYTVTSIEKQKRQSLQGKDAVLIIVINLNKRCSHADFINGLNENDSIHYIEEIR